MTVFRSCWADGLNHVGSVCQMNTGSILAGRPSMGSGSPMASAPRIENLPTFVVLTDASEVLGGAKNWSSGFLPATYQGTLFRREGAPILDLAPPNTIGDEQQRSRLDLLRALNRHYGEKRPEDTELEARMRAFELAYRMQAAAPEAVDLTKEIARPRGSSTAWTTRSRAKFGTNCLLARRLVERGVRFVELYSGSGSGWDAHTDIDKNHGTDVPGDRRADRRTAGRPEGARAARVHAGGLGRRVRAHAVQREGQWARSQSVGLHDVDGGRRHEGRQVIGSTDEIGLRQVERPVHVHDLHATILWAWGWIT